VGNLTFLAVNRVIKTLTHILCRIDAGDLAKVPIEGPLILVCNHVNFLDIPILATQLQPRRLTGFIKKETWDNPVMGWLFTVWGGIPIQRGEADLGAIRSGLKALQEGCIVAIAPEGTRSGDGKLRSAHPGLVTLALHSQAPLLPLVYYGNETFHQNFHRLKRTDFHVVVGRSFYITPKAGLITREVRSQIACEVMYQLAALLPLEYRGIYTDLSSATTNFLTFVDQPAAAPIQ
jgi:1-acyl-sn-glycerol-3-phosphate acyltransferase